MDKWSCGAQENKLNKQGGASHSVSFLQVLCSVPVSRFLPSFSGLLRCGSVCLLYKLLWVMVFSTAIESQLRHITFFLETGSLCISSLLLQCWRWSLDSHMWHLLHSCTAGFTTQYTIAVVKDFMCMSVFPECTRAHGGDPGSRVTYGCELSTGC